MNEPAAATPPAPLEIKKTAPLSLSREHLAKLRSSALTDEQIRSLGWSSLHNGHLLIPYLRPDGSPETCHNGSPFTRERLSDAEIRANPKGGKYRSPKGEGCRLFHSPLAIAEGNYPQRLADRFTPLRITEGELKTVAANIHDPGRLTIGLGGVSSWRDRYDGQGKDDPSRPIVDLEEIPMERREVRICFDSDREKPQVAAEMEKLSFWLAGKKGAHVLIEVLPNGLDGKRLGVDDLINRHGPEVFQAIGSIAKDPFKWRKVDGEWERFWAFDPQPSDTRERNIYLSGLIGRDWKASTDAKDHWLRWIDTHWENVAGDDAILRAVEDFMAIQGWKNRELSTVRSLVAAFRRTVGPALEQPAQGLLPLRNGCLILADMRLIPHAREHGNTWSLPYGYTSEASCSGIEAFLLDRLEDVASVAMFRAFARALLTGDRLKCFLEIYGPGNTGKSVVGNLLVALVGFSNTTAGKLQRLEDPAQRFETLRLRGKRLAVFSEAGDYSGRLEVLKALTGGDPIGAEIKGGRHLEFTYQGGVVLVGNAPIRPTDPSGAVINRRRSLNISKVVSARDERVMLESDGNGDWRGELVAELPGFVNWALAMPPEAARSALARDVQSLARAEMELAAILQSDPLAQWADDTLIWSDSEGAYLRVGRAGSKPSEYLFPSYLRHIQGLGSNTRPLSLNTFKSKLVDLLRDTLSLPLPPGNPSTGAYSIRDKGSVIPHLELRRYGDERPGVIRHAFLARIKGTTSERPGDDQTPVGNDRNDRNDLGRLTHMEEKKSDDFSPIGERGPKVVTAVPVFPHKGFGRSEVVPQGTGVVPTHPVLVDGQPGWHLPAPLPARGGPSTCVLAVDPLGQSQRIQRRRITGA